MINLVSHNGKLIPQENLRVPFSDRGFLFGDGAFTTMRVHNGIVENIGKHLSRLNQNCQFLNIVPPTFNKQWIKDLITENNALEGTWRLKLIVTGGTSKGLGLEERMPGDIVITLAKYTEHSPMPYKLSIFPTPVISPTAKVKSLADPPSRVTLPVDPVPYRTRYPSPRNGETNVPIGNPIIFRVRSDTVGIDISTVRVKINGQAYKLGDPGFSFSGTRRQYEVEVKPPSSAWGYEETVEVEIEAWDLAGKPGLVYERIVG